MSVFPLPDADPTAEMRDRARIATEASDALASAIWRMFWREAKRRRETVGEAADRILNGGRG